MKTLQRQQKRLRKLPKVTPTTVVQSLSALQPGTHPLESTFYRAKKTQNVPAQLDAKTATYVALSVLGGLAAAYAGGELYDHLVDDAPVPQLTKASPIAQATPYKQPVELAKAQPNCTVPEKSITSKQHAKAPAKTDAPLEKLLDKQTKPATKDGEFEVVVPLDNPFTDSTANTHAYRTASRAAGEGIEALSRNAQLDTNVAGRTAETLLTLSVDSFLSVLSHEAGHYRTLDDLGGSRLVMEPFAYGPFHGGHVLPHNRTPATVHVPPFGAGIDVNSTSSAAGINQSILNAEQIWQESRDNITFLDAIGFINNRLNGTQYGLRYAAAPNSRSGDVRFYFDRLVGLEQIRRAQQYAPLLADALAAQNLALEEFNQFEEYVLSDGRITAEEMVDLTILANFLYSANFQTSQIENEYRWARDSVPYEWGGFIKQFNRNEITMALLDASIYESLFSIGDFIATGNREHTPLALQLGDFTLSPPTFQHYLAPNGEFANMLVHIGHPDFGLTLSAGRDLDFTQRITHVDTARFGAQLDIPGLGISPFLYLNTTTDMSPEYRGMLIGADLSLDITDILTLQGTLLYSDNDMVYNRIREESDGFGIHLLFRYAFGRRED